MILTDLSSVFFRTDLLMSFGNFWGSVIW